MLAGSLPLLAVFSRGPRSETCTRKIICLVLYYGCWMGSMIGAIKLLVPSGDVCGEGATWCPEESRLYWCDINRFLIHAYDTTWGTNRSWFFDTPVVALSLTTEPGRLLVALGDRLIWWWPETDRREEQGFSCPGWPEVRFNDGRADPLGNFWIGSMGNNVGPEGQSGKVTPDLGRLYRVEPNGTVTEWLRGIGISNTLCWSPIGDTFYFGDTIANGIDAFDFDKENGGISRRRPHFCGFERGKPDGSAIDSAGCLWNARFFGGCIVQVSVQGVPLRVIEMPVRNITTAAFGGKDLRTLFVTSASDQKGPKDRLAGSLMAIQMEVPGLPPTRFKV